jgi:hypothetical protein
LRLWGIEIDRLTRQRLQECGEIPFSILPLFDSAISIVLAGVLLPARQSAPKALLSTQYAFKMQADNRFRSFSRLQWVVKEFY